MDTRVSWGTDVAGTAGAAGIGSSRRCRAAVVCLRRRVSALNYDAIAPGVFEQRSWRLLTVLLAGAAAVSIAAGGLVRIIRGRDRRMVCDWRDGVIDLVDRCELAAARVQAMKILRRHWLVTAAVIARLVHAPSVAALNMPPPPTRRRQFAKLLMLDAELTDETRDIFLAELNPELAPRGWLNRRYQMMAERFVDKERIRYGVDDPIGLPPPEHCTYPLPAVPPPVDGAGGYRWEFRRAGLPRRFRRAAGASDRRRPRSCVEHDVHERAIRRFGRSFGLRSGVSGRVVRRTVAFRRGPMPSGLLPPRARDAPKYSPYVWWPLDLPVPAAAARPAQECRLARFGGSVLFHAVRVDISEPLDLERLVPVSEAGPAQSDLPPESSSAQQPVREPLM